MPVEVKLENDLRSEAMWQLASIGCPWWLDPGQVLMAALTAVFDASGDGKTSTLTVAGFLSSEADWRSFSQQWSERIAKDGIEFFRAVDAASFKGPFKHWEDREDKEALRQSLFGDLMEILKRHVYHRFGCVVINKSFEGMSETLRDELRLSAFTLAALTCEKNVRRYILDEWRGSNPQMPVRLVFEDGDEGYGDFSDWLKSSTGTIPSVRAYKKDAVLDDGIKVYGFVPLQASDWLAYELGLSVRRMEIGRVTKFSELRWPMREFTHILGDAGTYYAHDIKEVEKKLNILRTVPNWENETDLVKMSQRFLDNV
jgi:hypothetical protein